ncbi:dihydrofolate reductase-like domain-containing protein [Kickxella alabastrina]|uniref:dihydrofolate reductase-like domain-containing protein n=1 Tax=Kickxella alabastrina TaxID=61397 RepID=UPI00221EA866|nr:dihydrofolate reductase-like domain-containing protein [Kickxella alabastrina]KAI7821481.1 dihydrofolate reductase-like domain-containing protein [Kickxella alabastrina]
MIDSHADDLIHAKDFVHRVISQFIDTATTAVLAADHLDGKIALPNHQLLLSGTSSMAMTHRLRTLHDGILVGIGTVLCDNPRLTARMIPANEHPHHPRPSSWTLICAPPSKPWIVTNHQHDERRRRDLEALGARIVVVGCDDEGRLLLDEVVEELARLGVFRLMVEGGAQIIQAFLKSRVPTSNRAVVDTLIVTVAPVLVGSLGVAAVPAPEAIPGILIRPRCYEQFGPDVVMVADIESTVI